MAEGFYEPSEPIRLIIERGYSSLGKDEYMTRIAQRMASIELLQYKMDNGLLDDPWGGVATATRRAHRTISNLKDGNDLDRISSEALSAARRPARRKKHKDS